MSPVFNHILSAILITPLAGALVLLCVSGRKTAAIKWLANGFAGLGFLVSLPLWFHYEPLGKTWQFAERGELISAIGASYYLGVDGLSILLILLTTLMGWIAILASWNEIKERVKEFYVCMLVLQAGMLGVFMALDFLLFFLVLEVVLGAMYCVIRIWGGGPRPYPAITFLLVTLAGSVVFLVGILALYFYNHSVTGRVFVRYHPVPDPQRAVRRPEVGLSRILPRLRREGADVPVSRLAARRADYGSDRRFGDAGCRLPEGGHLWVPSLLPADAARGVTVLRADGCRAGDRRHRVRRARGARAERLETPRRILERELHGTRDARDVCADACRCHRKHGSTDQSRHLDWRVVPPCWHRVRASSHAGDCRVRRPVEGDASLRHGVSDHVDVARSGYPR